MTPYKEARMAALPFAAVLFVLLAIVAFPGAGKWACTAAVASWLLSLLVLPFIMRKPGEDDETS